MVELALSSYALCACVCEASAHMFRGAQARWGDNSAGDNLKRTKECDSKHAQVKRASICVFAIRQCVRMSGFDCRRFMSHKWWLTIHLPWTHTDKHTSFPLLPSSTDREEYVQAVLLMHIYTEHTLAHLLSGHSKGYCVQVCARTYVCLLVHRRVFKGHFERGWPLVHAVQIVGLIMRTQPLLPGQPVEELIVEKWEK